MELFNGVDDKELDELIARLCAYARRLLRKASWRGTLGGAVPGGKGPEDVVHDVVLKYASGERTLNPAVDLAGNLMGGVRSAVSALLSRLENTCEERLQDDGAATETHTSNPEVHVVHNELATRVYDALLERAFNDDLLIAAIDIFERRGEYTAGELTAALGLSELEALALRRRFSRALDAAMAAVLENSDGA